MIKLVKICPECGDVNILKIPEQLYREYVLHGMLGTMQHYKLSEKQALGLTMGIHLSCWDRLQEQQSKEVEQLLQRNK